MSALAVTAATGHQAITAAIIAASIIGTALLIVADCVRDWRRRRRSERLVAEAAEAIANSEPTP